MLVTVEEFNKTLDELMPVRYYMVCNGFSFECSEGALLNHLNTLNPNARISVMQGFKLDTYHAFETVTEALAHYSREFHNAQAEQLRSANAAVS